MSSELEALRQIPLFASLDNTIIQGADLLWEIRHISAGDVLWLQGAPSTELAFVLEGALKVEINHQVLGFVGRNDIIGELATFTKDTRSASVIADKDTSLLVLGREALFVLRDTHWKLYDKLLDLVLERLALRIRDTNLKIAKNAEGDSKAPERKESNVFQKFWQKVVGNDAKNPPSAISALRKLPGLNDIHPMSLQSIMASMIPKHIPKGEVLILEGERANSAYLIVEGVVEVYRNVRGGQKSQHLVSLYPGALLGTGALILSVVRNASCLASDNTDVWVYEMTQENHQKLEGEPSILWREAILSSLAFQLRTADDLLVVSKQGKPQQTDYDKVQGVLSAYQATDEAHLE